MLLLIMMLIRLILEHGSLVYMGAARSHLDKLDRVQRSAEKIGGFKVESLQSRREATAVSLAFDLLDGSSHSSLLQYKTHTDRTSQANKEKDEVLDCSWHPTQKQIQNWQPRHFQTQLPRQHAQDLG